VPADSFVFVRIVLKLTGDDDDTTDILCHISFLPLDGVPEEVEKPYRKLREDRTATSVPIMLADENDMIVGIRTLRWTVEKIPASFPSPGGSA